MVIVRCLKSVQCGEARIIYLEHLAGDPARRVVKDNSRISAHIVQTAADG